jgi:hypothetical protein
VHSPRRQRITKPFFPMTDLEPEVSISHHLIESNQPPLMFYHRSGLPVGSHVKRWLVTRAAILRDVAHGKAHQLAYRKCLISVPRLNKAMIEGGWVCQISGRTVKVSLSKSAASKWPEWEREEINPTGLWSSSTPFCTKPHKPHIPIL